MYTVRLMLFGLFRKNIQADSIFISLNKKTNLSEFKKIVANVFLKDGEIDKSRSVNESVFAHENEIMPSEFIIDNDMILAILPPVSGG